MGETFKAACGLLVIAAIFAGAIAWIDDKPNANTWAFRIGSISVVAAIGSLLIWLQYRRDAAFDYLHQRVGNYFNRDGFCFGFQTTTVDGVCHLLTFFQNQRDKSSCGRIALQPARGFFGRARIEAITEDIVCEPAAFGVATIPIPLAAKAQGRKQAFEVGAAVEYPHGRGRRVRYRDGIFLRANAEFNDAFSTALAIGSVLTGHIALNKPATVTMILPSGVAEEIPDSLIPQIATFWKLGDPPLDAAVT